jgi:hypothetical protein
MTLYTQQGVTMKGFAFFFSLLFPLILISCSDDNSDNNTEVLTSSGLVVDVPDGVPFPTGLGFGPRAESAWAFVRQSATWGDANSQVVDGLLTGLINTGLLQTPGSYTASTTIETVEFTTRLTVGEDVTISTASAFTGSRTYSRRFEMWRSSDNAKALEMFFDSATELGDDGVLLYYQPNVLDPTEFNGDNVVVESFSFQTAQGRKQTYSWSGGSIVSGGSSEAGRVILEEMDNNTVFCFKAVVRMDGSLNWCAPGGNPEYYSLGYVQSLLGSGEVTAKFGYLDNDVDNTGQVCGVSNTLNYGLFNSAGFVDDGVASGSVGASYPLPSRADTLFSEINTGGAGAWDDLRQATIDGLNIQFVSTTAP